MLTGSIYIATTSWLGASRYLLGLWGEDALNRSSVVLTREVALKLPTFHFEMISKHYFFQVDQRKLGSLRGKLLCFCQDTSLA